MIVLGIDPGIALTGWGVVCKKEKPELVTFGCIRTAKDKKQDARLFEIFKALQQIIRKYRPDVICLEKIFFNTNAKTVMAVGEARGAIKICALINKLAIYEFTPLQVKDTIVGYGRADKKQIQEMVKVLLFLKEVPKPDDAADAIAVALTYCFFNQNLKG